MNFIRLRVREMLDSRHINRYQVNKLTGIPLQTLDRYFFDKVTRYDRDVLLKLCVLLDCGIEDLIEVDRTPDEPHKTEPPPA